MQRMRAGEPTLEDIKLINKERCRQFEKPPPGAQIASHTNKARDAVNAAIFNELTENHNPGDGGVLDSACVVFMDDLCMNDSVGVPVPVQSNAVKQYFCSDVSESDCNFGKSTRGRVDPCLKLCRDAPMMLTQNNDVLNGEANGTRVRMKSVKMKHGEEAFDLKLDNGTVVKACFASQVKCLAVKHENSKITPNEFEVESDTFRFRCEMNVDDGSGCDEGMWMNVTGTQFPVISNSCTTGHKLQGATVQSLLVNDWHCGTNWAYVVSPRVRTMDGLHLKQPLSLDLEKHAKPQEMKDMTKKFEETISVNEMSDDEHEQFCNSETSELGLIWKHELENRQKSGMQTTGLDVPF